ncbi:MAG TPA: BTAD domain-containing putative transcriptional regulator [Streptosporangiaceae bacterium]
MDFRILGPLEVMRDGSMVELGTAKQRVVLGVLLLHPNEVVSADRLVDEVWGESPPPTAVKMIQGYVSGLRKALGAHTIVTHAHGYAARIAPGSLDAERFHALADEGRAALPDDPVRAADCLRRALALWRGDALEGLGLMALARGEAKGLEEQRVAVIEELMDRELVLGRHAELVPRLRKLVTAHPYRERLSGHLMLALYRSGRQAEALAVYRQTRRLLDDELGVEPSLALRRLEQQMLLQAPELDSAVLASPRSVASSRTPDSAPPRNPPQDRSPWEGRPREGSPRDSAPSAPASRPQPAARRLVTVVAADVIEAAGHAERLDPEVMHYVLDSHAAVCRDVIERHGGAVRRSSGSATVGIFGLTKAREDDAFRAVRAAVELRDALIGLNVRLERDHGVTVPLKLGLDSGEAYVSAGTRGDISSTGDVIEVALRLLQTAADGDILLGERVYGLVRHTVEVDVVPPASEMPATVPEVPARTAKTRVWRLRELRAEPEPVTGFASPLVGRKQELNELRGALEQAISESACRMVTLYGPPGIGKSRLAREFLVESGDRATTVVGRCLPSAEGAGHRALLEIVQQLTEGDPAGRIEELVADEEQAKLISSRILNAIGVSGEPAPAEETFWAVRSLLEHIARNRALLILVDDVHWAEPALLDLLDYLVAFSSGGAILILCPARPELMETRPGWALPQHGRSVLPLAPLADNEAHELVEALSEGSLASRAVDRLVATAEGNPFFLEQLVALRTEGDQALLTLGIHTVLGARIDSLEHAERSVLHYGAVEGHAFHRGAVAAQLTDDERPGLDSCLLSLVRKQLIRSDRPQFEGEDAFRFTHALIAEVAYAGIPKLRRVDLHEHVAGWLKSMPAARDETVGHHLEQAWRARTELGQTGKGVQRLAAEAADRYIAAGRAALLRNDLAAAAQWWERVVTLLPRPDPARTALLPKLGAALCETGRFAEASQVLTEAIDRARTEGSAGVEARAIVELQRLRLQTDSSWVMAEGVGAADRALRVLAACGDDLGQCRAWCLKASISWAKGQVVAADHAWQQAAGHARRAQDDRELFEILGWRASAAAFGPMAVDEAIALCTRSREQVAGNPAAVAVILLPLGLLHAMRGDIDEARRAIGEADAILDRLGWLQSIASQHAALVEILAGQPAAAEKLLRTGYERLAELGEKGLLATSAAMLAQALVAQGRFEEATDACQVSRDNAGDEDIATQVIWRGAQAKILVRRHQVDEARELARHSVRLAESTDLLPDRAEALADLADVLSHTGDEAAAIRAARQSLALHEEKGNTVSAQRVRSWLTAQNYHEQP